MPFEDKSFDVVVSCHVLEHIPVEDRDVFLEQLCAKAKKSVVLLNPFQVEGVNEVERLQLHIDIIGAWWAKEHLECSLPLVEDVEKFSKQRGYKCEVKPHKRQLKPPTT
ncbi:class I SAM-dependent methyltransferase [methane-oxidizing endosymbiont of Gigantopelta aegis]|uniref:class I SAM-dependent methyltransferase n=1 Tax=methane-oxidizing endosymbiont of Gigantopelta aegis TaxID=2794938 RepID=UPI0018DE32D5|nr:class I SAM-dependent methyltransferase [methane-oxidizing endosymbiont of Gigantopelta aegis]